MSAAINVLPQRPSLLDRRASNNIPDLPDHLSVSELLPHTPLPLPSTSGQRGNPRRPTAGFLPFVPLTPIMASPLITPEVAHASPAMVLESAPRQVAQGHGHQEGDYITHHPFPPNPTWTTSPPTPPPKNPSCPRLAPSTPPSPARAIRHRSTSRSRHSVATRAGSRPASVSHFVPSSLSYSCSPASPSTAPNSPAQPERVPARRMSLPSDLSKPLPPRPDERSDGALTNLSPEPVRCETALIDTDPGVTLLPSLSRRTPTGRACGASVGSDNAETGTLRSVGKKLFNLDADEGDPSDDEDAEQRAYKEETTPAPEERDPDPDMGQTCIREQEKEKAEQLRQYHALRELLTTEVGYLLDLRALVTVYLDQLLFLSSPPTTPPAVVVPPLPSPSLAPPLCIGLLPPPTRTLPSFSGLSIPSFLSSSRSSYIQPSPLPTPSPSVSECLSSTLPDGGSPHDRERQPSGASSSTSRERHREREDSERVSPPPKSRKSHSPGLMLIEREVRAVSRNAHELLQFHERFVAELRDAVEAVGFRGAFAQTGEQSPEHRSGEDSVTERVEHAVEVVAAKFVNETRSLSIYETFCPGHTAAVDLVRRVQERWPTAWDAYEQRCASLVSHSSHGRDDDMEPEHSSPTSPVSEPEDAPDAERYRKRRYSTPALSFAISASTTAAPPPRTELPFPVSATTPVTSPLPTASKRRSAPKLKFMDYLIKPVQRICKYPLLLDQLHNKRRKRSLEGQTPLDASGEHPMDEAVRTAAEAMRGVVDRVNQASEKEAHNLRSALIASRISFSHVLPHAGSSSLPAPLPSAVPPTASTASSSDGTASSHSHSNSASSCSAASTAPMSPGTTSPSSIAPSSPVSRPLTLTADFISSLGPCMLAGALDVIQHPSHRAKYLGAFLYAGGYCILAKIYKGGRVYEPRHWFSLRAVEVIDAEEDDASFPYSFRISGFGHHLEVAASCSQEKSIWLTAIHDALSVAASWRNEPLSSLQSDDKSPSPSSAAVVEEPQEYPNGLPTIQSMSELERQGEPNGDVSHGALPKLKYSRTLSRLDGIALKSDPHSQSSTISAALSRRSSTASVKAFFSPMAIDPARIQRVSMQSRAPIDQGLHDVFSESCLAARAQAQMRGEELFQVRTPGSAMGRRQGSGMSRSNSGLSIASAMGLTAAKRKYDMVSRRNRSVDLDMSAQPPIPPLPSAADKTATAEETSIAASPGSLLAMRGKPLAVRRHKKQPASIAPAISTAIAQMNAERQTSGMKVRSPDALSLDSPPEASHCSSVSSILPSPVDNSPLPIPVPGLSPNGTLRQSDVSPLRGNGAPPKRARSMVDKVRYFFQPPRSDSPTPSSSSEPDRASPTPPLGAGTDGPTPDYSSGIVQWLRRTSLRRRTSASSPSSSSASIDEQSSERRRPLPTRNSTDGVAMRTPEFLNVSPSPTPRRTGLNPASPKRHRSLFVPSSRSRNRTSTSFDLRDVHEVPKEELMPPPLTASRSLSARKSLRNMLLFQRSNALTPLTSPAT